MVTLIPTPEWRAYVVAVVVVCSLASTSLASKLQPSVAAAPEILRFLWLHNVLMAGIVTLSVLCISTFPPGPRSLPAALWQLATGLVLGHVALVANNRVVRHAQHSNRDSLDVIVIRQTYVMDTKQRSNYLILLCGVAILEEVLFRGVLVELSFMSANAVCMSILLILNVPAFAVTHAYSGLVQVISKLPLGLFCLGTALVFQSLLPPVVIHTYFNVFATGAFRLRVPFR